jgi:hypothetical protein
MELIKEAFSSLFPEKEFTYTARIKYSGKFRGFNANVRYTRPLNVLTFNLSKQWKNVSDEIKIGLLQSLMVKVFKTKKSTEQMEMYASFLRHVHIAIPKTATHPVLEESFLRVNAAYFDGLIEKPNLRFGKDSKRQLGCYEYGTDTITITALLTDAAPEMLDYVMYHELLHKKIKFFDRNGKSVHHTTEFRQKEKEFLGSAEIEQKLKRLGRKQPIKRFFDLF